MIFPFGVEKEWLDVIAWETGIYCRLRCPMVSWLASECCFKKAWASYIDCHLCCLRGYVRDMSSITRLLCFSLWIELMMSLLVVFSSFCSLWCIKTGNIYLAEQKVLLISGMYVYLMLLYVWNKWELGMVMPTGITGKMIERNCPRTLL